jgi:hypothetical protein
MLGCVLEPIERAAATSVANEQCDRLFVRVELDLHVGAVKAVGPVPGRIIAIFENQFDARQL